MHIRARSLTLIAAALLAPAAGRAAPGAATAGTGRTEGAVLIGFETSNGDSGVALRLDGVWHQTPLSPQVGLALVGSVGYSRWSEQQTDFFYNERLDSTLDIFRIIPAARFTFGTSAQFRPYLDAGIGLYHYSVRFTVKDLASGLTVDRYTQSETGLALRLAGGVAVRLSETFSLGGEIDFQDGSGNVDSSTSVLFGATFRL